jgi:hypothetical protein
MPTKMLINLLIKLSTMEVTCKLCGFQYKIVNKLKLSSLQLVNNFINVKTVIFRILKKQLCFLKARRPRNIKG